LGGPTIFETDQERSREGTANSALIPRISAWPCVPETNGSGVESFVSGTTGEEIFDNQETTGKRKDKWAIEGEAWD
jgi:hypothetical protein